MSNDKPDCELRLDRTAWRQARTGTKLNAVQKEAFAQKMHAARRAKQEERRLLAQDLRQIPLTRRLSSRLWEVAIRALSGMTHPEIAEQMGYASPVQVSKLLLRPDVQSVLDEVREAQLSKVMAGEFGPLAIAKASAVPAMQQQVKLMKEAKSEAVQLDASEKVLNKAGFGAHVQVDIIHHLLGGLNDRELEEYASGRSIPEKLRAVLPAIDVTPLPPDEE